MIIGLAGYARSGKDTAADTLEGIGFGRIAFADALRKFMYAMNPGIKYLNAEVPLRDIIDHRGWDGYKDTVWGPDIRRWLQVVGTECVRDILGQDTWVNATFNAMDPNKKHYVITDVRFPNEVEAIRNRGGMVLRVWRPGVGPANSHHSETALDDYRLDGILENTGTLEEFERKVRSQITKYLD